MKPGLWPGRFLFCPHHHSGDCSRRLCYSRPVGPAGRMAIASCAGTGPRRPGRSAGDERMEQTALRRLLGGAALGYIFQGAADAMDRAAEHHAAADGAAQPRCCPPSAPPFQIQRLFGMSVADLTVAGAVTRIIAWSRVAPARTVFVGDLVHAVSVKRHRAFAAAHAAADMVTPGGSALVWLSQRENTPLDRTLKGEDLVGPLVAAAAKEGRSLFLVGTSHKQLHPAARVLQREHRGLKVVGLYAPTGFERETPDRSQLFDVLKMTKPDIILVGLPTPEQEVWADAMANSVRHGVFVCVGEALSSTLGEPMSIPLWVEAYHFHRPWRFWLWLRREIWRITDVVWNFPALLNRHRRDRRDYTAALNRRALRKAMEAPFTQARRTARTADREAALKSTENDA